MKEVKVKIVVNPLKDIINNKDTSKAKELSENLDKYVKMFRKTKFEKLQKDSSYQILTNKIIIQ
jgi:CO dehydrogenase/acetyl-CoA synthase gamma subunit (corrinoid Fe-S protein)